MTKMVYGLILAGGNGSRMGKTKMPKQFLALGKKPVIIHTLEQFLIHPEIDKIVISVSSNWVEHTKNLFKKHLSNYNTEAIIISEAIDTPNDSIIKACKDVQKANGKNEDDIIVIHDGVRPFVTQRIITDNIEACKKYRAVDTVIPAHDTIVHSKDGKKITQIPVRDEYFRGQRPQTFFLNEFLEIYKTLTAKEKKILTDCCKVYSLKGKKVYLVMGEPFNMKVTTPYDIKLANTILSSQLIKNDK